MAIVFADLVRQAVASAPGTASTISLAGAQTGWLTFALAGVANGATVRYAINDNGASEIGTATYNSSGPSLTGRTPTKSTNSNAAINASAQAIIIGCLAAEDTIVTLAGSNLALNGAAVGTSSNPLIGPLIVTSSIGINVVSPSTAIHVLASGSAPSSNGGASSVGLLRLEESTGGNGINAGFYYNSPAVYGWLQSQFVGGSSPAYYPLNLNPLGGDVGIGTTAPDSLLTVNANTAASASPPSGTMAHLVGAAATVARFLSDTYGATSQWSARRADGTIASPSAIQSGENILNLNGFGYGATGYSSGPRAAIIFQAAQNWTDTAQGTQSFFQTTPINSIVPQNAVTIFPSGAVGLNVSSDPGFLGSLYSSVTTSGTFASQTIANQFVVTDTANVGGNFLIGMFTGINFGGSTVQGGRQAIEGTVNLTSATSGSNTNRNYVGVQGVGQASAADTGTNPTTGQAGGLFGICGLAGLLTGATSWANVTGGEYNVFIQTGASAFAKTCIQHSAETRDRVQGTVVDTMSWFYNQSGSTTTWKTGLLFDNGGGGSLWPFSSSSTLIKAGVGSSLLGTGIDLSGCTVTTPFISRQLTVTTSGSLDLVQFGNYTNPTQMFISGNGTGANGGSELLVQAGSGVNAFLLGNYSAVWGTDRNGAANFDLLGVVATTSDIVFMSPHWAYFSGFSTSDFNTVGTAPTHPSGLAIGWNYLNNAPTGGETDFVNNIGGKNGPWDFVFQDWNGTTLTDLFFITSKGGFYTNSTLSPTQLQATTFPFGTLGTVGGSINSGTADTWSAMAMTSADPTLRTVPYTTAGQLISNSFNCTTYVGYSGPGSGDPSVNGASQVLNICMGKANAFNSTGTGVYGQTGCLWMNAFGGWNGTQLTSNTFGFVNTGNCTTTATSTQIIVPAAPTSHRYYTGMPVSGANVPGAFTGTAGISGSTLTLSSNIASGTIAIGQRLFIAGVATNSFITAGSGQTTGSTWTVTPAPGNQTSGTAVSANATIIVTVTSGTQLVLNNAANASSTTATLTFQAGIIGDSPGDTYLWVGQSQVSDIHGVGLGSEIFEATSSTWVDVSGVLTQAYKVRIICAPVCAQNQSGTGFPINGLICNIDQAGLPGFTSNYGYAFFGAIGNPTLNTWAYALGIAQPGNTTIMAFDYTLAKQTISDPTLKQDISILPDSKGIILGIDPVSFRYKHDVGYHHLGFLASDHLEIKGVKNPLSAYPGHIVREVDLPLDMQRQCNFERKTQTTLCQEMLFPILWKGVQELWADVDQVLDRMNGIEARVTALESRTIGNLH